MLICKLRDEELARRLGEHLYQQVTLRGIGLFFARDFTLLDFNVDDFSVVRHGTFDEINQAVRSVGTGWDSIDDPLAEIQGMR